MPTYPPEPFRIKSRASIRGYKFAYAPELLRHFTARFEPL